MTPAETQTLRAWVKDYAYAEDDFVLKGQNGEEITELLNALDPGWRDAFNDPDHERR